jgi:transposase
VGGDVPGRQLCSGEKGGAAVGKTKRGKGTKWMVLVDGGGLPLGVRLESASPGEVTLAEATLAEVKVPRPKGCPRQKPKRIIADRAYDSDPLRERLAKRGIDLIVPYRKNSKLRRYEDGRKLRRYKRRWIIERTNAWLGQFRRLIVRHENLLATYRAFFYLACLWITLRRCCGVEMWRGVVGLAYLFPALSSAGASLAGPCSVSTSRSSNRTCGFPASGSR